VTAMQPAFIRVFDGLRITTEHIDHFQGSLHSAMADVRRILGTARVHRGFAVAHGEGATVVVQPGLAFDIAGNRIVSDDPITLDVPPLAGNDIAFVCVAYAQVESGVVDGKATLVFDSCLADIRRAPPSPLENVLVLARLVPKSGEPSEFEVVAQGTVGPTPPLVAGAPSPAPLLDTAAPGEVPALPATTRVHQDVIHLSGDDASRGALTVLRGAMKRFRETGAGTAPSATLASAVVPVGFAVTSLAMHAALDATVRSTTSDARVAFRAISHGDATMVDAEVAQQCVSQVEVTECSGSPAYAWRGRSGVSQSFVAALPLAVSAAPGNTTAPAIPDPVLRGLVLGIALGAPTEQGLTLSCTIAWDGDVGDDALAWLDTQAPALDWNAAIAWKAMGAPGQPPG
jgi:hypothetical protein